jgi:F0F1-type ATP synthase assembly protein I
MALPHYKLHTPSETPAAFPVLLAPTEAPSRFASVKQFSQSRKLLIGLVAIVVIAGAALLWILLDPGGTAPKPIHLLIPAIALGLCLLIFVVMAIIKNRAEASSLDEADAPLPIAFPPINQIPPRLPRARLKTELNLEKWSSEPFQEIMDEAVMAEVFDDDLVAPDHMIFSLKVADES